MTPVPLDLPLRPNEAAELASLIFDQAERKPLTDEVRNRIAARAAVLRLETVKPYFGSLERDPVHPSVYYLAVDADGGVPLLLHMALATAPTSSIFSKPLLIGRMRRLNGPEMVINAIPFGASDCEHVEEFCARIGAAFLPRPQGSRTAITVASDHPLTTLPAVFDAFRAIQKRSGRNLASVSAATAGATAAGAREFYCAALWSAIRAGWRDGYNATIRITVTAGSVDEVKAAIRRTAAFSTFAIDAVALVSTTAIDAEQRFDRCFSAEERGWIFDEFARRFEVGDAVYEFPVSDVVRLAVEMGPALRVLEQLHETVRQARAQLRNARSFDFEVVLEDAATPADPRELIFCLHWLRQRGHAAQLVAPRLAGGPGLDDQLKALAAIALHYQAGLSINASAGHTPETLAAIARATVSRINYRLSGTGAELGQQVRSVAEHLGG